MNNQISILKKNKSKYKTKYLFLFVLIIMFSSCTTFQLPVRNLVFRTNRINLPKNSNFIISESFIVDTVRFRGYTALTKDLIIKNLEYFATANFSNLNISNKFYKDSFYQDLNIIPKIKLIELEKDVTFSFDKIKYEMEITWLFLSQLGECIDSISVRGIGESMVGNELTGKNAMYKRFSRAFKEALENSSKEIHKINKEKKIAHWESIIHFINTKDYEALISISDNNFNHSDNNGNSLLHYAIELENQDVVNFLIKKGCNVNIKNKIGITPLMIAAKKGERNIVILLLDNGSDANLQLKKGIRAIDIAIQNGHNDVVNILHEYTDNKEASQQNHELDNIVKKGLKLINGYTPLEFPLKMFDISLNQGIKERIKSDDISLIHSYFEGNELKIDAIDFQANIDGYTPLVIGDKKGYKYIGFAKNNPYSNNEKINLNKVINKYIINEFLYKKTTDIIYFFKISNSDSFNPEKDEINFIDFKNKVSILFKFNGKEWEAIEQLFGENNEEITMKIKYW